MLCQTNLGLSFGHFGWDCAGIFGHRLVQRKHVEDCSAQKWEWFRRVPPVASLMGT